MKIIFILGLSLLVYVMGVAGDFVQDDLKLVASDPEMGKVSAIFASFTRPYYYIDSGNAGIYRPLTSASLYINGWLLGNKPWGFHLVNVFLYAVVCGLVFEFLKTLLGEKKAFWLGLVFVVLPVHTEAVNNIVGRAEMLSLGFVILAVILQKEKTWELGAVMYLLAILSKEVAIVGLPILVYLLWVSKESKDTKIGMSVIYVMITACFLFLRTVVLGTGDLDNNASLVENPLKFMGTEERVRNAFALVPFGAGKIVFPVNLSYDYSFNQISPARSWFDWRVILGFLMMGASLGSLFTKLRHNRTWIVGQALFWGPVAITGNFLFPSGTIFGERLWFWPSLGLLILLGSCCRHTFFKSARYFGLVLIMLFALRTVVRNVDWLSQKRLFLHDANYAMGSVLVMNNKAAMYLMDRDLEKGKEALDAAEKIYPKYPELMNNVAMYWLWSGETEKARQKFEECLVERPGYYLCQNNLDLLKK